MKLLTRALLLLLLGLSGVLPLFGEDGGEGAGGTGIWILPSCRNFVCGAEVIRSLPPGVTAEPRASLRVDDLTTDVVMRLAPEVGPAVAMLVENHSGEPILLPVNGSLVRLEHQVLSSLAAARVETARILILDGDRRGYAITVRMHADLGGVDITVD